MPVCFDPVFFDPAFFDVCAPMPAQGASDAGGGSRFPEFRKKKDEDKDIAVIALAYYEFFDD